MTGLARATAPPGSSLETALDRIAATAQQRDAERSPAFPEAAFVELERTGATTFNAAPASARPPAADELHLVRRVARADGSVGRIFDGHLNAVERMIVQGSRQLAERELTAFSRGELRGGVWGGDPVPGEGPPATIVSRGNERVLRGVKTFCSGAGGIDRALVLARSEQGGPPISAWIDVSDSRRVAIDPSWYRSHGLRASVSHRVVFEDAPVLAQLGPPGAISAHPWFSRDALRTAASWAGMADAAVAAAIEELAARPSNGELEGLAVGRMLTAQGTITAWLDRAAASMDQQRSDLGVIAIQARAAIADACRTLLDEAARACGSRPFARAAGLDRARRDLEVFLLQHRLDPLLARAGAGALEGASGPDEQPAR